MNRAQIFTLSDADAVVIGAALTEAGNTGRPVTVTIDGGLKIKIGGGMWTPPLGTATYPEG